ncbi:MAG: Asp-tRNA(Asn)/Glu-tRNA(Gln) amidotransferase subunit GatC [Candidatus Omnitrophica bacterium]|nr:Asp-tRNA(Asn)/Glu-tRNA(Gln) amidotransferase subunit GatC [Candidatus Omnitrophota bacterium]
MSFEIEKIAGLARLHLKPEEAAKLKNDLEAILGYVKKLETLDTQNVSPTSHVLEIENVFRPDQVNPSQVRDEVLKHAPGREGNFFKVPKVVDK